LKKSRLSPIESIGSTNELQEILDDLAKNEMRLDREGSYLVPKPQQIECEFFKKESSFLRQASSVKKVSSAKTRASSSCSSVKLLAEGDLE
jgi:hypothetical protein